MLSFCERPTEALKFARYLAASDRGGLVFKKFGFETAGGDKWAAKPEMVLYCGGVNRPAIEKILHEFADREGVNFTTVFNGCGILCAAMKTMGDSSNPKFPDVYYACDVCFVPPVAKILSGGDAFNGNQDRDRRAQSATRIRCIRFSPICSRNRAFVSVCAMRSRARWGS